MRSVLRNHPAVNVFGNEPHYLRELYKQCGNKIEDVNEALRFVLASSKFRPNWVEPRLILSAYEGRSEITFSEFFYIFFGLYFEEFEERPLVIKDPRMILSLDSIQSTFCRSDVKVIHVIRDPRAVVSSITARWRGRSVLSASLDWRGSIRSGHRWQRENLSSYFEIRYDDIVVESEKYVKQVCDFLGLQFHSCLLDVSYKLKTWDSNADGPAKEKEFNSFDSSRHFKWRSGLTDTEVKIIERTCNLEMEKYCYPLVNAKVNEAEYALRYVRELSAYAKTQLGKSMLRQQRRVATIFRKKFGNVYL